MTRAEAKALIGNQPKWAIRNMATALCLMPWLNTPTQWRRVEALAVLGYAAPRSLIKKYKEYLSL